MKILYFDLNMPYLLKDNEYSVGGSTIQWLSWIQGFAASNHQVGLLTWRGAGSYVGKCELVEIVEAFDIGDYRGKRDWINKIFPSLRAAVKRYAPDVVVQGCAGTVTGILGLICCSLRVPFVYRVANDIEMDGRLKERLGFLQRVAFFLGLFSSHAIICQNDYQFHKVRRRFPWKRVAKIPNPFDISTLSTEPIRPYRERKYVAWLGIFQYQKNLPALVQVATSMPQLEFRIAGRRATAIDRETGQALSILEKLKNVTLVGYLKRSEIQSFLAEAYLLLNTSWYEGFSNTFLESFFSGTPVIAPKFVDPDGIIISNNLGLVTEDYNKLPMVIEALLQMRDREYNLLAGRCREYVITNHNSKELAQRFIKAIR